MQHGLVKIKQLLIGGLIIIMMSSMAMGTVSRGSIGNTVTYTTNLVGIYDTAYWAVDEITSCSITGVSCSVGICEYTGNSIRVVGNTPDGGGSVPPSISVTVSGSGQCTLNNGQWVESTPGNLGSPQSISGSVDLIFSGGCMSEADTNPVDAYIDWTEINDYVVLWLGGSVSWTEINLAVSEWISGC